MQFGQKSLCKVGAKKVMERLVPLKGSQGCAQWPMPVIPATWEADTERIEIRDQPRQKVSETLSQTTSQLW
jgi:hypothetical protein